MLYEIMTEPDFWGKKFWGPKFGPKLSWKLGFLTFLQLASLVFFEIAYDDSLQQCLTFSRGKIHKKKFWDPNMAQNWVRN